MSIKLKPDQFNLKTTMMENLFIEQYMIYANEIQNKVYILGLALMQRNICSIDEIAKRLKISLEDVINAFKYWEEIGIIKIDNEDIIYISLRQIFIESNYEVKKISNSTLANNKYKDLFKKLNSHLNTNLIEAERMKLIQFLNNNPFDNLIILEAYLVHKKSRNRTNKAIDMLINLKENNVTTLEDYYEYKEKWNYKNMCYSKILTAIGKRNSYPNIGEKECIDKWLNEYEIKLDDILKKIKEITKKKSNVNMNYLDAVFSSKDTPKPKTEKEEEKDLSHLITYR